MSTWRRLSCLLALVTVLLAGLATAAPGKSKAPVFVAIDDASTATIGPMPVDRTVYARAIDAAMALGAKSVVLKFFFDTPGKPDADARLAAAIARGKVLMQVEPSDGPGRIPIAPFARDPWNLEGVSSPFDIGHVDPPLAQLERGARAVGFVAVREGFDAAVEVAGRWEGRPVPSLQLEAAEAALDGTAQVDRGELALAGERVRLDPLGRVSCDVARAPALRRYGIDALLGDKIRRAAIEGRVVVLGYGRSDSPMVALAGAKVAVHEAFNRQLSCLYRRFAIP